MGLCQKWSHSWGGGGGFWGLNSALLCDYFAVGAVYVFTSNDGLGWSAVQVCVEVIAHTVI